MRELEAERRKLELESSVHRREVTRVNAATDYKTFIKYPIYQGRYLFLNIIARGGFGAVFKVWLVPSTGSFSVYFVH
jgi:hypothetical protein